MTEEEKKAIERLKLSIDMVDNKWKLTITNSKMLKIILNIIDKQQKEIEELKKPKYIMNFETGSVTKIDNDFISKDKIEEILKKYKKRPLEYGVYFYREIKNLLGE